MANKKKMYMVFYFDTATLPMADEVAQGDANIKKKIAIAKPLVYDAGWTICDRAGNIHERKQFLIAETFSVPSVFNTAYYKEKRPIYLEMLKRGEIVILPWNDVMDIFMADLEKVDAVGAFNSMFDFKKAIPFTELYINMLYSPDFYKWEEIQYNSCRRIAYEKANKNGNPDFDAEHFSFRGRIYDLFDLWGLATTHLLNNSTYKQKCLENEMLTASGIYFKTSAESSYRYLCNKYDFDEAHTALDDAEIESFILHKIAQKHAITNGIKFFPFRDLGYTYDFAMRRKIPNVQECQAVINAMTAYIEEKEKEAEGGELSRYANGIINHIREVAFYAGINCNY